MATMLWETTDARVCERIGRVVRLEVLHVYPDDRLPDQPPQVRARRCSEALLCNTLERPTCAWSGTLPGHNPLG